MNTKTQEIPEKTQSDSHTQAESDADLISGSNDHGHSFEIDMERPVLDSMSDFFDAGLGHDELDYHSEDPVNLPEDSVVDTESDGQNYVYEQSDGDHEDDEDYIMEDPTNVLDSDDSEEYNDVDIEAESIAMKGKGKGKKVKPFFHLYQSLYY